MRHFSRIALGFAGAAVLVGSTVIPATADDTPVSANVSGYGLEIAVPETNSLAFGEVTPGQSPTLGVSGVTVTDLRAGTTPWVASVNISGFTADGAQSVDGFALGYAPGLATFTSGIGVAGVPTTVDPVPTTPANVQQPVSVLGNNTATWDATVTLHVPGSALEGSYGTTLTHSVL
ncbi:hypothetical protein ACH9EU_03905 [Kocuria sp. M1R5S2]|uniref:hypothetical protein n=1 Tax=Kocuria rhizosphaerae TaxID=3376285 RepID=UPI0037AFBDD3